MNTNNTRTQTFYRRIGSTKYKVLVSFSESSKETMEDKLLRIIRNFDERSDKKCDIITVPQMSRQSERSA